MEPRPSSDQKKKSKEGSRKPPSASATLCAFSRSAGKKAGNLSLKELRSAALLPPTSGEHRIKRSGAGGGGRGTGREDTLASFLRPLPAPVFGDQVSYTRGFWSCIIRCSAADERKLQRDALTHRTPQSLTWMPSRPHPHDCHCVSVSAEHARHTKTHAPQTPSAALRGLRWTPGGGAAAVR